MNFYRDYIQKFVSNPLQVVTGLFALHIIFAISGWIDTDWVMGSMLLIWIYPLVFSSKEGRKEIGIRLPVHWSWWLVGPIVGVTTAVLVITLAWFILGLSDARWLVQIGRNLDWQLGVVPSDLHTDTKFWILILPPIVVLPLAMEILYRGYIQRSISDKVSGSNAAFLQAGFHTFIAQIVYDGFGADVLALWIPSMLIVYWSFGIIRFKSASLWPSVLGHTIYLYSVLWFVYYRVM